jgi:sRNA-binding protein
MIKKIFAVLLLSLTAAACESSPAEKTNATPSPAVQISPTPAPSPSLESSATQWKAGDKVKVTVNGSAVDATIVSIDEKAGYATVKVQGETKERTVKFTDIAKQ